MTKYTGTAMVAYLAVTLLPFCWCLTSGYVSDHSELPEGLSSVEKLFLGKWAGSKERLKWEIDRKPDRSFEIVMEEVDPTDPSVTYHNYATGEWSVRGDSYYCEWKHWVGDEGDFSGIMIEKVAEVMDDRVVTVSDGGSKNTELRVEFFQMPGWSLKKE
ncbi:hypothetical protein [Pelagicoccus sp. SDUM812003]|uniref:hypothetical protein n=1 Tax=Pelagicoccus sp. SDUM812003 TaxID=3041267 RepID=UPI00280DB794|nr:hypothetical protein [Pelagicoccus sp. SDUM812003]MDQ8201833.1 hypothetical protein [Pelagicoccus sp. SDUM812003]